MLRHLKVAEDLNILSEYLLLPVCIYYIQVKNGITVLISTLYILDNNSIPLLKMKLALQMLNYQKKFAPPFLESSNFKIKLQWIFFPLKFNSNMALIAIRFQREINLSLESMLRIFTFSVI